MTDKGITQDEMKLRLAQLAELRAEFPRLVVWCDLDGTWSATFYGTTPERDVCQRAVDARTLRAHLRAIGGTDPGREPGPAGEPQGMPGRTYPPNVEPLSPGWSPPPPAQPLRVAPLSAPPPADVPPQHRHQPPLPHVRAWSPEPGGARPPGAYQPPDEPPPTRPQPPVR